MHHHFSAEQWLPYPVETVFGFFANPENLPPLMPAWQKARIDGATFAPAPPRPASAAEVPDSVAAGAGTRMKITFRPLPLSPMRLAWQAEITEFVWNEHFCDVQLSGPFAFWRHCHRLHPEVRDGQAGTLLRDEVEYEMHLGLLGELAQRLFVGWQFRKMFEFRHKRTAEMLASGTST